MDYENNAVYETGTVSGNDPGEPVPSVPAPVSGSVIPAPVQGGTAALLSVPDAPSYGPVLSSIDGKLSVLVLVLLFSVCSRMLKNAVRGFTGKNLNG